VKTPLRNHASKLLLRNKHRITYFLFDVISLLASEKKILTATVITRTGVC